MFTQYTYQDWLASNEVDRPELIEKIINAYKASDDFKRAMVAQSYFNAQNLEVGQKTLMQPRVFSSRDEKTGKVRKYAVTEGVPGNRIYSNFFFRFVTQQNQYLLANGVTLKDTEAKKRLGLGFDKELALAGEKALVHGVCWGFWNYDHLEIIPAYTDGLSGFVALLDERTGAAAVGIRFWQLDAHRPLRVQLFEGDGLTEYVKTKEDKTLHMEVEKKAYTSQVTRDAAGVVSQTAEVPQALPLVPLYANEERRSELTKAIKSKIDLYDRILSDFGDNLDKANDVYWVLNNFGGNIEDIAVMLAEINRLKAIANISDGTGASSTVEPMAFEVPYSARQTALELLSKALYQDYMALSMDELTGGSLTNVAIETARANMDLKANLYENQVFSFVQGVLSLAGIETEEITFKRQNIANTTEIIQNIYMSRDDLDLRTRLKLNPYVMQEEIEDIIRNLDVESVTGLSDLDGLQRTIDGGSDDP